VTSQARFVQSYTRSGLGRANVTSSHDGAVPSSTNDKRSDIRSVWGMVAHKSRQHQLYSSPNGY